MVVHISSTVPYCLKAMPLHILPLHVRILSILSSARGLLLSSSPLLNLIITAVNRPCTYVDYLVGSAALARYYGTVPISLSFSRFVLIIPCLRLSYKPWTMPSISVRFRGEMRIPFLNEILSVISNIIRCSKIGTVEHQAQLFNTFLPNSGLHLI